METTIICRGNIGGYIEIVEKKLETIIYAAVGLSRFPRSWQMFSERCSVAADGNQPSTRGSTRTLGAALSSDLAQRYDVTRLPRFISCMLSRQTTTYCTFRLMLSLLTRVPTSRVKCWNRMLEMDV